MIIKDGTGKGHTAKVDANNRVSVLATIQPLDQAINATTQKVFSLPFKNIDPVGADDYFFYIKNTGSKDLRVTDIRVESTVAGSVEVHGVTGTPSYTASADVVPVNRTIGSSNVITATIKTDTNTTGLTSLGTLFYVPLDAAGKETHLSTSASIIIPPGQAMALLWDTSTGVLSGVVSIVEVDAT